MKGKLLGSIFMAFTLLLAFSSCERAQEKRIINGTWELTYFKLDTASTNAMEVFLPNYQPDGCCEYIIDFRDDGSCLGSYYTNDTLNYEVMGEWDLLEKNSLYIDLDAYVDGTFDIDRHDRRNYTLYSPENTGSLGTVTIIRPAELTIKRTDI